MLTADIYREVCARLAELGHGGDREWSQSVGPPATAEDLAQEHAWVVLNSGMRNTVADQIWQRVRPRLLAGQPIGEAFRHPGKRSAIENVWRFRNTLLASFTLEAMRGDAAVVAWCAGLPWIGPITKYHLAKNLGADVAKPDRWLVRLADVEGETVDGLCARLAATTGDRVATVDVVLWRACAVGVLLVSDGSIEVARPAARSA